MVSFWVFYAGFKFNLFLISLIRDQTVYLKLERSMVSGAMAPSSGQYYPWYGGAI